MAELGALEDEDQEAEPSEFEYLMLGITHIITCLYKFSIATRNPVPKERLHKIARIDVSHFEHWDIKHVDEKFCPADPQNDFKVKEYLTKRLGKANTRRRQLLKYYEAHHNTISKHIDGPSSSKGAIEKNVSANPSKPVTSTRASEKITESERAATVHTGVKSQTTVSTIKVDLSQAFEVERDEDRLSQTSYAASTNNMMRIRVPPPPNENAFGGEPFECPYCFNIIEIKTRQGWKYVGNYPCSSP